MPIRKVVADIAAVVGFNTVILSVTTFANIEILLKIILLLVSIGFTLSKWINRK